MKFQLLDALTVVTLAVVHAALVVTVVVNSLN